jgi:hypothetical protein
MGLDGRAVETPLASTPDWIGSNADRLVENTPDRQLLHVAERDVVESNDEVVSRTDRAPQRPVVWF